MSSHGGSPRAGPSNAGGRYSRSRSRSPTSPYYSPPYASPTPPAYWPYTDEENESASPPYEPRSPSFRAHSRTRSRSPYLMAPRLRFLSGGYNRWRVASRSRSSSSSRRRNRSRDSSRSSRSRSRSPARRSESRTPSRSPRRSVSPSASNSSRDNTPDRSDSEDNDHHDDNDNEGEEGEIEDDDDKEEKKNVQHSKSKARYSRNKSRDDRLKAREFSHSQRLQFNTMRKEKRLTDMKLKCQDQTFSCHKLILASSSKYFERMFESSMNETISNEVTLEVLTPTVLSMVLDYMYTTNINMSWKNISEILRAADYLQMDTLKEDGSNYVLEYLKSNTALRIHKMAKMCNLPEVEREAWHLIMKEFCKVVNTKDFMRLSTEDLEEVIKDDNAYVFTEDPVLYAVLLWTHYKSKKRTDDFLKTLFPLIRLEMCTKGYLCNVIQKEELLASQECQARLAKALASATNKASHAVPSHEVEYKPRKYHNRNTTCLVMYAAVEESSIDLDGMDECGTMWHLDEKTSKGDGDNNEAEWIKVKDVDQSGSYGPDHKADDDLYQKRYALCAIPNGFFLSGGEQVNSRISYRNDASYRAAMFSFDSMVWDELPKMSHGRWNHASVCLNEEVFVLGGSNRHNCMHTTVEVFFLDTREWNGLAVDLPHRVEYPAVVAEGACVYVLGGLRSDDSFSSAVQIYNTALNLWQRGARMPLSPQYATAVSLSGEIYVVGGYKDPVCMSYSTRTDTWVVLAEPTYHHAHATAIVYKGGIMLCGGQYWAEGQTGVHNQIERYDMSKNEWSQPKEPVSKLPKGLSHLCMTYGVQHSISFQD